MSTTFVTTLTIFAGTMGYAYGTADSAPLEKPTCCAPQARCCALDAPFCGLTSPAPDAMAVAGVTHDAVAGNTCCVKRAYCCTVRQRCCPKSASGSKTGAIEAVASSELLPPGRSTCCVKRAYCCSTKQRCCGKIVLAPAVG